MARARDCSTLFLRSLGMQFLFKKKYLDQEGREHLDTQI